MPTQLYPIVPKCSDLPDPNAAIPDPIVAKFNPIARAPQCIRALETPEIRTNTNRHCTELKYILIRPERLYNPQTSL